MALPTGLGEESVLCFEQSVTILMIVFYLFKNMIIYGLNTKSMMGMTYLILVLIFLVFIFGLIMNILTYFGL